MAISITVNSTTGTSFDVNAYLGSYPGGFSSSALNFGLFYDGATNDSEYTQYGLQNTSTDDAFLAGSDAGDLTYSTGNLDGSLDTLSFGEGLNYTYPGVYPFAGIESTSAMTLDETVLTIDNLGLDDTSQAGGTGDDVHDLLYGLMTGDSSYLETYLAANDIEFQGGAGNDTFVSGAGADVFLVSAGSDTYTGGSGVDTYDFGDVANAGGELTTTILDFADEVDVIDLRDLDLDAPDVVDATTYSGATGDTTIDLGGLLGLDDDATIVVADITKAALLDDILV